MNRHRRISTLPGENRIVAVTIFAAAAACGLSLSAVRRPTIDRSPRVDVLERRIDAIAEAIALAEGYYASGDHDGRSLPYVLNNPGALKKPPHGSISLPTWRDTGLICFPTRDRGWAALRHQVRAMLTGTSDIYLPSDSLTRVATKYADGNLAWGSNVAARLGVPAVTTLAELASGNVTR